VRLARAPKSWLRTKRRIGRSQTIDSCTDEEKAWVSLQGMQTHDRHAPLKTTADQKNTKADPTLNVAAVTVEIAASGIRFN
jgi:hypothetical protein